MVGQERSYFMWCKTSAEGRHTCTKCTFSSQALRMVTCHTSSNFGKMVSKKIQWCPGVALTWNKAAKCMKVVFFCKLLLLNDVPAMTHFTFYYLFPTFPCTFLTFVFWTVRACCLSCDECHCSFWRSQLNIHWLCALISWIHESETLGAK